MLLPIDLVMFKRTKNFSEFARRVEILWDFHYAEREHMILIESVFGAFNPRRIDELMAFKKQHPEYHIVSCVEPGVHINTYIPNSVCYYLGEGESDPLLISDAMRKVDAHYIQSRNATSSRSRP